MNGTRARIWIGLAALAFTLTGCQAGGAHKDSCCDDGKGGKCMMVCDKCGASKDCSMMHCAKCNKDVKTADIKMTCPSCKKEMCSAGKMMEMGANGSMKCAGCGKDVKAAEMVAMCKCGATMTGADMMHCKCGGMMACKMDNSKGEKHEKHEKHEKKEKADKK